jgi:hypothetical protein
MKQIRFYIALMFVSVLATSAMAQLSPVDFMRNNPRAVFANPATFTVDHGYFDLGLGGINIGLMNTGLKYNKFFQFDSQGYPTVLDLNKGINSLHKMNYLNTYANVDIFNCGRRTKYGYFTYTHRFREIQSMSYSKDLVQLLAQGNGSFLGEENPANIDIRLAARAFQEFDFGYQMSLMEQLNIGVRLKFLMGFMDLKANSINMKVFTDPNTYALTLTPQNMSVNATVPIEMVSGDSLSLPSPMRFNPASLFKNYGGGIDLGAEYRIDDQWGVAAAINDLGFIVWNNYAAQFNVEFKDDGLFYDDGSFVFSGLNSEQVNNILHTEGYTQALLDTLKHCYQISAKSLDKYTTGLNTNLMVRGYYDLTPEHRFTAQLMGYNMGLGMKPAFTLAYTGSFNNKYDVVATYTMMPGSFDNIGIGLSANFGGALLYFATNNLLGLFNPANITQVNAQFGISFTSGEVVDRSEMIIIRDKEAEANAEFEGNANVNED